MMKVNFPLSHAREYTNRNPQDRLLNVLAHEYCHLANFMISNIRDNPHGKEFKEWYI